VAAVGIVARREQARIALDRANHVRLAQARTLRMIRETADRRESWRLAAALVSFPATQELATLRLARVLRACRSLGPAKAATIMRQAGVGERTQLCALTERQRAAVAVILNRGTLSQDSRA
jgi:hypothetical protein